ncbi:hypothetical protein OPV22_023796 [Ensete ventricosum]|uniref:Uncharacterized protein n=1 Tax=Ensete ventricosum TaxID=4639 RepID=A0AAV8QXJ7_ENSVE|nr:hypothetical protein OPV22_023796 [Ensete ventricosum]
MMLNKDPSWVVLHYALLEPNVTNIIDPKSDLRCANLLHMQVDAVYHAIIARALMPCMVEVDAGVQEEGSRQRIQQAWCLWLVIYIRRRPNKKLPKDSNRGKGHLGPKSAAAALLSSVKVRQFSQSQKRGLEGDW